MVWRFVLPHDVSLVNRLFFWCAPFTIARSVMLLRIYPVQRRAARSRSHIGEEVLETLTIWFKPSVANTNAFTSMMFAGIFAVLRFGIASKNHPEITG